MNPPSIWPRSTIGETRRARVFQNVHSQQPRVAGEPIHLDFGNRRAVDEIVERTAAQRGRIVMDLRRSVIALREQRDPLPIRRFTNLRGTERLGFGALGINLAIRKNAPSPRRT